MMYNVRAAFPLSRGAALVELAPRAFLFPKKLKILVS